jgi:hypothetical protein
MKDLIEKILAYLPKYFIEFSILFSGPKKFISEKNTNSDLSFTNALLFLSISIVITVIMTFPLLPEGKDIWEYLGSRSIGVILSVTLFSLALRLSWRIVGGKASIKSFFVTYSYFSGVILVLVTFFILLGEGVFKVLEPDLYENVRAAQLQKTDLPDFGDSKIPIITFGILVLGFISVSIWGMIGWGAYRSLNQLSKWRSFCALLLLAPFGWLISAAVYFITSAMS